MAIFGFSKLMWEGVAIVCLGLLCISEGKPVSSTNLTISVDENDPRLYCEKTNWYDICWFFFSNYVLQALSVRSLPGENTYSTTAFKLCCLLVPYTGLRRGLCLISRASNLAGNDLQSAASANALCMIIRTAEWRPKDGDVIAGCEVDVVDSAADQVVLSKTKSGFLSRVRTSETVKSMRSFRSTKSIDKNGRVDLEKLERSNSVVARNAWKYRNHFKLEVKDTYQRPACQNIVEKVARALIETYRFSIQRPTDAVVHHEHVKLQGYCELIPGYALCYIPADMKVYPRYTRCMTDRVLQPLNSASRPGESSETRIASAHNVPRVIFSIGQTVSGGYALYRARGPQIERYGFAAFGLTVIPYMLISIVNFFGALLTSEYETIFLVHSSIMDEMVDRGGRLDGVVGTLHPPTDGSVTDDKKEERMDSASRKMVFHQQDDLLRCWNESEPYPPENQLSISPYEPPLVDFPKNSKRDCRSRLRLIWNDMYWALSPRRRPKRKRKHQPPSSTHTQPTSPSPRLLLIPSHPPFTRLPRPRHKPYLELFCIVLLFTTILAPYIVIYSLTYFHANNSTPTQRSMLLQWLICGQAHGYFVGNVERLTSRKMAMKGLGYTFLCYGCYFLGGFVIVAQEMIEAGDCKAM